MPFVLVALAIVLCAAGIWYIAGLRRRQAMPGQRFAAEREPVTGLVEPVADLPPVLLPEHPSGPDVDAVRFSIGLRGYRCDQVDEVLDRLAARITELENGIHDTDARRVISDTGKNWE